jgi:hypothetical protein
MICKFWKEGLFEKKMNSTAGIVINTTTLTNAGMCIAFCGVALFIVHWTVSFALWKWQDLIDRRAEEQQQHKHRPLGRSKQTEEEEEDAQDDSPPPPPTHWTSKKSRRRHVN